MNKPTGWRNESGRHSLAAKGVSTSLRSNARKRKIPILKALKEGDRVEWKDDGAIGTVEGFAPNGDIYVMCETPPYDGWSIQVQRHEIRKLPDKKRS